MSKNANEIPYFPLIQANGTIPSANASAAAAPAAAPAIGAFPSTTTISPVDDIGRQIALDFCMEF